MRLRLVLGTAFFATLALAPVAHADFPWPAEGAPLCVAPLDQSQLLRIPPSCGGGLGLAWLDLATAPAYWQMGGVGIEPPSGACPVHDAALLAPLGREGAIGSLSPAALGIPGCIGLGVALVWLEGAGASQQIVAYVPQWLGHERVVVDSGDHVRHQPRVHGSGYSIIDTAAVVVWADERTGVSQIRAQRVSWQGVRDWGSDGLLVAPAAGAQSDPEITRLGDGGTLIVWLDERSGGRDVYAQHLLQDGSVAPGWPAAGLALEARADVASNLQLASFFGPAIAVWEEQGARFGGGRNIVALQLGGDGLPDPAWNPLGVPLSTSATVEHLQDASFDGYNFTAVWTDTRSASVANPTDVYAQRLVGAGVTAPGWPASGVALCTAPGRQDHASVNGNAFAWEDGRGADTAVYAQLLQSNSSIALGLWIPNGLAAAPVAGSQTSPVVGGNNAGGFFVAWVDARNAATSGLDLYAQAFTSEGENADVPPRGLKPGAWLGMPYPNPSRGSATFRLALPEAQHVELAILDVAGRVIARPANGAFDAGESSVRWNGLDAAGRVAPPGLYRVRLRAGAHSETHALVRVR